MTQRPLHSLLEAFLNTLSGFLLSYLLALLIIPVPPAQNAKIVLAFTALSFARTYLWRRAFNWWHRRHTQ